MKKQIIFILFMFLIAGKVFGQFNLDKFLNEKLSLFDSQKYKTKTGITVKNVDDKYEKIPIKLEYMVFPDGGVMRQSITTATKDVKEMKKLFDLLLAELTKKVPKKERDETYEGVRNVVFRAADNTLYTLGNSSAMTILTMVKMQ